MRLIGFRDWDWQEDGYRAGIPSDAKPYLSVTPNILYRAGSPPTFGPSQIGERSIPVEFMYRGGVFTSYEEAWDNLLTRLNYLDTRPGQLRAEKLGKLVACEAILTMPVGATSLSGISDVMSFPMIFVTADPLWKEL